MVTTTAAIRKILTAAQTLRADKRGATAVEYSILIVMIMVALTGMVSFGGLSDKYNNTFDSLAVQMKQ